MRRPSLGELSQRYKRLHGAQREEAAFRLACLTFVLGVLEEATKRRERAERHHARCVLEEADRWDQLRARFGEGWTKRPRRPVWFGTTWTALALLAETRASEEEWFASLGEHMAHAVRALDVLRPEAAEVFHVKTKEDGHG